jgi:hypothetical protein
LLALWAIPAVCFASLIGVAQTKDSMPRILKRFPDLKYIPSYGKANVSLSGGADRHARLWEEEVDQPLLHLRAWNGGMPSQRPDRWDSSAMARQPESCRAEAARWSWLHGIMAALVVSSCVFWAWGLSASVPPHLFYCRQIAQSSALWVWIICFVIQYVVAKCVSRKVAGWTELEKENKLKKRAFWWLLFMDSVVTAMFVALILWTQLGVLNQSSKYSS